MRIPVFLGLITISVIVAGLPGCSRQVTDSEYDIVIAWLTCDHCLEEERAAVQSLGSRAIPSLAMVVKEVPEVMTSGYRRALENTWSPEISEDRETFVRRHMNAFEGMVQMRAAVSLGDLAAVSGLRRALKDAVARGYGEDLIRVIRGALQWAENQGPVVAVVRLMPNLLSLSMGSTGTLAISVEDEFGNSLDLPLDWSSSSPSTLLVDSGGALTPVAPGPATITAMAGGIQGQATVNVVPAQPTPPRIHIVFGDHQEGLPGTVLPQRVWVQILAEDGTGVADVYPEWRVLQGGGSVQPFPEPSDGSGVASAWWTLGDGTEPQRLEARLPNSNAVVFRATVIPG